MKDKTHNEEDALKRMLKESGLESPSKDFTASIMKMVAPESKPAYLTQPVFSKQQILFFVLLFGGILIYAMVSESTFSFGHRFDLSNVSATVSEVIHKVSSPILLAVIISGWTLYIFDRLIKRNVMHS